MSLAGCLADGIATLGLDVPAESQRKLLDFLALLEKWNATYNLTAVHGHERMLTHHLLDSLAVLPHVRGETWVDVGSGAGLPGIPVALARPAWRITLVESSRKKAAFLRQATMELSLRNVTVVCERAEDWRPQQRFDVVIARALSDLSAFLNLAGRLVAESGIVVAMKGAYPADELARLAAGWRLEAVVALAVPGLDARRHLVLVRPA